MMISISMVRCTMYIEVSNFIMDMFAPQAALLMNGDDDNDDDDDEDDGVDDDDDDDDDDDEATKKSLSARSLLIRSVYKW